MTATVRRAKKNAPPSRRRGTQPSQWIIYGFTAVVVGVIWAVVQALIASTPGSSDVHIVLKVLPWVAVLVGLGLAGYGYNAMQTDKRAV